MDNVTHTLVGATLARAAFDRSGRGTTVALLLASNAPDVDIVAAAGGTLNYLAWHRGPTHGPLGVVGLGTLVALIVWAAQRTVGAPRASGQPRASLRTLMAASTIGVLGHVLMDLPTSYGTRLLSPFDWHWYGVDLMPIVDVYLWIALIGGLLVGRRQPARRATAALAVLGLLVANYGVRAIAHERALTTSRQALGPVLPSDCPDAVTPSRIDWWPREAAAERRERATRRCLVEVAAIPTFFSPFRWHAVLRLSDSYQTFDLDLLDRTLEARGRANGADAPWRQSRRYPDQWTPAALLAARGPVGQVFLDFSRFPATRSVLGDDRVVTVRWTDLRFAHTSRPPPLNERGNSFFTATVVVSASGRIATERLGE